MFNLDRFPLSKKLKSGLLEVLIQVFQDHIGPNSNEPPLLKKRLAKTGFTWFFSSLGGFSRANLCTGARA